MEIKNLTKVADRIKKAIRHNERIVLYGDADPDGVASVIILKDSIKNLGGETANVYFPHREKEGYGLTKSALSFLKKFSPGLLITLDCGISNFEEIKLAKKLGFETLVIDHHEILDKLPAASLVVDPKQPGDKYPFKGLANAGLVYKLAEVLLADKLTDSLKRNFLELTALATIFDMMPEIDDNKIIIDEGLSFLPDTWRPGLKVFLETDEFQNAGSQRAAVARIISVLNITEPIDHSTLAYQILTSNSLEEAKIILEELLAKRDQKQREIREITEEVESSLSKKENSRVIFEGNYSWPLSLLGSVASRICNHHQKPTFLFKKQEKESRGAMRTPGNINGVELMKKCSKYLISFGGHPKAAGFFLKNENLEKFKECLIEHLE